MWKPTYQHVAQEPKRTYLRCGGGIGGGGGGSDDHGGGRLGPLTAPLPVRLPLEGIVCRKLSPLGPQQHHQLGLRDLGVVLGDEGPHVLREQLVVGDALVVVLREVDVRVFQAKLFADVRRRFGLWADRGALLDVLRGDFKRAVIIVASASKVTRLQKEKPSKYS